MTLDELLAAAVSRGLNEIVLRESVGGWQAIAKFHGFLKGPWSVGTDEDPVRAARAALMAVSPKQDLGIFG